MNIQKEFENRVKMCCEERVYANAAPSGAQTPYLTYFRQSAAPATLDMDGSSVLTRTLLQVDSCGSTYDEAVTLAGSVRQAIEGWEREYGVQLEKAVFEVETGLHHVVMEISVWHP